jgi:hypothetical protein
MIVFQWSNILATSSSRLSTGKVGRIGRPSAVRADGLAFYELEARDGCQLPDEELFDNGIPVPERR